MSDLAWAVKNGDLDQVKEMVDNKVGQTGFVLDKVSNGICAAGGRYQPADRRQTAPALCQ